MPRDLEGALLKLGGFILPTLLGQNERLSCQSQNTRTNKTECKGYFTIAYQNAKKPLDNVKANKEKAT